MLATPMVPQLTGGPVPDLAGSLGSLPLVIEVTPLVLVVLTMLVGIFTAAVSVILVYHWRRFPFEHATFRTAEHVYVTVVMVLLAAAVVGILIA